MGFWGYESSRETLKFRCPATAFGFHCEGWDKCHGDVGCATDGYGRVIRVPLERDPSYIYSDPTGQRVMEAGLQTQERRRAYKLED